MFGVDTTQTGTPRRPRLRAIERPFRFPPTTTAPVNSVIEAFSQIILAIPGAQENVIEDSLGAIVETHFDAIALRNCGSHNAAKMHRHMLKTTHEPACAGGSNGSLAQPVLHCTGKTAH